MIRGVWRAVVCRHLHTWRPDYRRVGYISPSSRCVESWVRHTCRYCHDDELPTPPWPAKPDKP